MATQSVKERSAILSGGREAVELRLLFEAIQRDITALSTQVTALVADHNTLVAKLNLDAGVTDVNYAVSTGAAITQQTLA